MNVSDWHAKTMVGAQIALAGSGHSAGGGSAAWVRMAVRPLRLSFAVTANRRSQTP